jgi:hypothetical protein
VLNPDVDCLRVVFTKIETFETCPELIFSSESDVSSPETESENPMAGGLDLAAFAQAFALALHQNKVGNDPTLKFPEYDPLTDDLDQWMMTVDRIQQVHKIPDKEVALGVSLKLRGTALTSKPQKSPWITTSLPGTQKQKQTPDSTVTVIHLSEEVPRLNLLKHHFTDRAKRIKAENRLCILTYKDEVDPECRQFHETM